MSDRTTAVLALALFGVLGILGWVITSPGRPGRPLPCPSGYVAVFRADLTPACAPYVVEPVR